RDRRHSPRRPRRSAQADGPATPARVRAQSSRRRAMAGKGVVPPGDGEDGPPRGSDEEACRAADQTRAGTDARHRPEPHQSRAERALFHHPGYGEDPPQLDLPQARHQRPRRADSLRARERTRLARPPEDGHHRATENTEFFLTKNKSLW